MQFWFCNDEDMIRETEHHDYICGYYGASDKEVQSFAKANESFHRNDTINGHNQDLLFQKLQKWSGYLSPVDYVIQATKIAFRDFPILKENGSTIEANNEMKKR